ncbi:neutral zinc metallopeptidase [Micromonospora sp. NPDC003197]
MKQVERGSQRIRTLGGLLAVLVVTLACGLGPDGDPGGAPGPSAGSQDGTQDGTMTVAEFERDVQGAVEVAEQYWRQRLATSGQQFEAIRRVIAYQRDGELACAGESVPRNNAVYCPAGDFIAYDVNWAVAAFRQIGDAFLFYLLGHEYAHGIQVRLGIRYEFTIQQELQADCMAGAYIGDSVRAGSLALADGDLDELRSGLLAVGDAPGQPWFAEGAHGTAEQRTASFFAGYERSLAACELK